MKFAYYRRLPPRQQRIYDRSDEARLGRLPNAGSLEPLVTAVTLGLERDERPRVEAAAQALVDGILERLHVPRVEVRVLAVRPSSHREELHGLYEFGGRRTRPLISVWMRTAQRRQVVATRTFLRTLLHEVVHHLDYALLRLGDSYHTQGFYKRAEALYKQVTPATLAERRVEKPLVGVPAAAAGPSRARASARAPLSAPQAAPKPARPPSRPRPPRVAPRSTPTASPQLFLPFAPGPAPQPDVETAPV